MISTIQIESILCTSKIYKPKEEIKTQIKQNQIEIRSLISGSVKIEHQNNSFNVDRGNLFILKPNESYKIKISESEETLETKISLRIKEEESVKNAINRLPKTINLTPKIMKIIEAFSLPDHNLSEIEKSEEETFNIPLAEALLALIALSKKTNSKRKSKTNSVINAATNYISTHYYSDLNVNDISAYCGVTVQHLSRLFKQYGYPPPMKYFWEQRLNRALEFLTLTRLSIKEIAEKTGFKTTHHFSNKIKHKTGFSPKEYRNNFAKQENFELSKD